MSYITVLRTIERTSKLKSKDSKYLYYFVQLSCIRCLSSTSWWHGATRDRCQHWDPPYRSPDPHRGTHRHSEEGGTVSASQWGPDFSEAQEMFQEDSAEWIMKLRFIFLVITQLNWKGVRADNYQRPFRKIGEFLDSGSEESCLEVFTQNTRLCTLPYFSRICN